MYQEPQFVLVEMNDIQNILASTSLVLDPLAIIRVYSYRFWIKCTFQKPKQLVGVFCYPFWSKYMSKLSYYQNKGDPTPLERVKDKKSRKKVLEAARATEMHMALSCIAMGILQSLSINYIEKISSDQSHYQRIPSLGRVSEATLMHYFRKHFSPFGTKARIMHNANNTGTPGRIRRTLGFSGFLVVQTFNCQVYNIRPLNNHSSSKSIFINSSFVETPIISIIS